MTEMVERRFDYVRITSVIWLSLRRMTESAERDLTDPIILGVFYLSPGSLFVQTEKQTRHIL